MKLTVRTSTFRHPLEFDRWIVALRLKSGSELHVILVPISIHLHRICTHFLVVRYSVRITLRGRCVSVPLHRKQNSKDCNGETIAVLGRPDPAQYQLSILYPAHFPITAITVVSVTLCVLHPECVR